MARGRWEQSRKKCLLIVEVHGIHGQCEMGKLGVAEMEMSKIKETYMRKMWLVNEHRKIVMYAWKNEIAHRKNWIGQWKGDMGGHELQEQ